MGKMAVLIVDVQKALVEAHPYREEEFLQELENLADSARKAGTEIIYVRPVSYTHLTLPTIA